MWRAILGAAVLVASLPSADPSPPSPQEPTEPEQVDVYVSGEGGYDTYRIPSAVVTPQGTLLAFCEGRRKSASDTGYIDLLLRRSSDGGRTWSEPQMVWDDGENTCGNPCAVVDRGTGTVWLLLTWNSGRIHESRIAAGLGEDSRRVFVTSSSDDGVTWAEPREITADVKDPEWSWYATGPGAGIQLERGEHRGRLVIPCDHKHPGEQGERYLSHVIWSDDHGQTWELGGSSPRDQVNECEVVELEHGRLMLNMRSYDPQRRARQVCFSDDGGATWTGQRTEEVLVEPICQASLRRLRWPEDERPGVLLFSNPASADSRTRMTVRASYDDGETWEHARLLHEGGSAYSCLVALPEDAIGCLYEADGYKRIVFARFDLEWVTAAR
jgi:sialidase-1